jgi:hypothetical protein
MARAHQAIFVLLSAFALNGCVAVAAIPVLAGGAVVTTTVDGEDGFDDGDVEAVAVADGTVTVGGPEEQSLDEQSQAAPVETPASPSGATASGRFVVLDQTDLPTPGAGQAGSLPADPQLGASTPFIEFLGYALEAGEQAQTADLPPSALLLDPTSVDGDRLACTASDPAVVIDLDPEGELFDPNGLAQADTVLALGLGQLRRKGISIFWISGHSADMAGSVRRSLAVSGLDIENQDSLLLMRYPDDRKQTRRRELSETHCVVAIAGDKRADFDELFDYLLDPSMGEPLDALIGEGWFLTPPALTQTPSLKE